jgi:hypothetical protein
MIKIVIPSAGRWDIVLTKVSDAILYVPEKEADKYAENNPEIEIITHGPHKNLAQKRQEIYDKFRNVFMIDDDIYTIVRLYTEGNNRKDTLTPDEARDLIYVTEEIAAEAGAHLFGFSTRPTPLHYISQEPIQLNSYINASAFGLLWSDKLYFSENLIAAESHWINLLNAYFHRFSWCDTRFCFSQMQKSTHKRQGGQAANRTIETEKADTLFLRKMFGEAVSLKKSTSQAKLIHPYQRTLRIPL